MPSSVLSSSASALKAAVPFCDCDGDGDGGRNHYGFHLRRRKGWWLRGWNNRGGRTGAHKEREGERERAAPTAGRNDYRVRSAIATHTPDKAGRSPRALGGSTTHEFSLRSPKQCWTRIPYYLDSRKHNGARASGLEKNTTRGRTKVRIRQH